MPGIFYLFADVDNRSEKQADQLRDAAIFFKENGIESRKNALVRVVSSC